MRFEDLREELVDQLQKDGITDAVVLSAFRKITREDFVLPHLREFAYRNQALPINAKQTISQPFIIALMMQSMELKPTDVVLEVGTGSGYQTALIAEIADKVCTVERHKELTEEAKKKLTKKGYKNIFYKVGDGTTGWYGMYPPIKLFDKIVVCAAAPSIVQPLIDQLAVGGKLVIPVGSLESQKLNIITKNEDGIDNKIDIGCSFVPLIGEEGWD
ncbi:MAG: protein-L-isoaspartate O-methyltransferase [Candidatus Cloacimonetes bacterium 4572_65]|nr:MAG: protein-L-isoaspartate O-methyltransferase [Candidatus Cloacimonetes bacterium 4572_65]